MDCYNAKIKREEAELRLIRQGQIREARDTLETPVNWGCPYCQAVNRGNFCSNCGSPRKRADQVREDDISVVDNCKK